MFTFKHCVFWCEFSRLVTVKNPSESSQKIEEERNVNFGGQARKEGGKEEQFNAL